MQVKAFLNINSLLSNNSGVVAQIGELSPFSYTFSRERGFYQPSSTTEYDLITFITEDNNGQYITLTTSQVDKIVAICDYLRTYIVSRVPPYNLDGIKMGMYAHFPADIGNMEIGDLVSVLPQWISWTSPDGTDSYTIWFQDEAFRHQYEHYEILVVDPLPTMSVFGQTSNAVNAALNNETMDKLMQRAELERGGYPETVTRVVKFEYVDPLNSNIKLDTYWPVVIYGLAGDHIDAIKDAIIEKLASMTFLNQSQWAQRFPDIYSRTEFIVTPLWNRIAIPNMLTQSGIYSQINRPSEFLDYVVGLVGFYNNSYVRSNTYSVPTTYKALDVGITNGPNNVEGLRDFRTMYPDYIPIPSTSLDFNRMVVRTQEMHRLLHEMVTYAETMTRYSFLPTDMRRIWRNNRYYLARVLHGANFLVLPKAAV